MLHKYDRRGAGQEGIFAEKLYDQVCQHHKLQIQTTTEAQDVKGVDRLHNNKKIDIKARKNKIPPNTTWIELSAAGKDIGTGWAYKDKYIAQLMIREENNNILNAKFGEYHTKDLVSLLNKKINFKSKAYCGKLYEVYTRWTNGQHRGSMTVIHYDDLETLPSFLSLEIPPEFWEDIRKFYGYN